MTNEQEIDFWNTIESLNRLELLPNLVVIGSWAEYLYQDYFDTEYVANIQGSLRKKQVTNLSKHNFFRQ